MLVGDPKRFAIEAEPEISRDDWLLGHFRFWLAGRSLGNWEDTTDLKGCVRWLRDFAEKPRDRFDQRLTSLESDRVFHLICDSIAGPRGIPNPELQPVPYSFHRFNISHLGMSSFDRYDILLIKDERGAERCLWREASSADIMECRLEANEMEGVAAQFCDRFEKEVLGSTPSL